MNFFQQVSKTVFSSGPPNNHYNYNYDNNYKK